MSDIPPPPEGFTLDGTATAAAGVPPPPQGFTLDSTDNASIPEEAGKGFMSALYGVSQGFSDILDKMGVTHGSPEARKIREQAAEKYKQYITENAPAVPGIGDIKSAHDFGLWASSKLGSMGPYIAGALAGGVPLAATMGAASSGEQEAQNPDATPASITTAAAQGGVTNALRVPFLTGSGGVLSRVAKGALVGGPVVGAVQGATQNIPRAVATGDIDQGLPTSEGVWDAILGNSLGMGTFAGAHAAGEKALTKLTQPAAATQPDDAAKARLAQRISDTADQNDFNLKKVAYDAGDGAKAALDTVHNGLAEDIKGVWDVVKGDLDQSTISNVNDLLDRTALNASIRSAKNKVKGRVGEDDLADLQKAVGHTQEGQVLVDLVRQSNALTDLFSNGLKGGVSRFTDYLNPLGHGGPENGYTSVMRSVAPKAVEAGLLIHNPALGIPMAAGFAGGRAIDALTGRRSTVDRFVSDNSGPAAPIDFSGTKYSILDQQARQAASIAALARQAQAQKLQADQSKALKQAQDQFQAQQQAAEAARLAGREKELRTQNRLDNNPGLGGFDRSIYDQTGIRPNDAVPGLFELFRTGRITPSEFHGFFEDPKSLMQGNAGNHIIDMLDQMARNGQLERDPEWQAQPSASANTPQVQPVANRAAYEAQAAGNQARVTAAMERVANSEHSSNAKQRINDAISAIGRTNNRADAESVRQNLVQSLATHSPEAARYAHQELEPLVKQIRHATADTAVPKGADLRAVTTDVTRDGNDLTRTLAAAYKLKNGINKPAYDGKREPDQGYLTTVADFHDKAVHDPNSPAVKESYGALARETVAQFKSLGGLKVETWKGEGEPYRNSKEMMRDVGDNHHLWFLPTDSAFGSGAEVAHPMLAPTGLKTVDGHPLLVNDAFRIVHDIFGHTQHGFQFGPVGEYNAFREHAQMYSDAALPALAAETLAQNAWVNFGPHSGLPVKERPFSDQKAYAFPPELIARDPNLSREFVDHVEEHPEGAIPKGADISASKPQLHDLIPGYKGIYKYLSPSERADVTSRTVKNLVKLFTDLPSAKEMAAVAFSGRAKKGWYRRSANAITSVFGQSDAPRFAGLLAALSPQTDVETNFNNAVNVWRGWIEAGRPHDEASIVRIMSEELPGAGTDMETWVRNSLRALTAEDGAPINISGAKVSSFMQNLLGEVTEVANDTWMANWAGLSLKTDQPFKWQPSGQSDAFGNIAKKGTSYLAMSALTRKAADILTKQTGETWTPAEVQETVWSWAKALYEKASSKQRAADIVKSQSLTHGDIDSVPDFERLFVNDTYSRILDLAGYGDDIDNLKYTLDERSSNAGSNGPGGSPFDAQGSGFGQGAFNKYLAASAGRLDALKYRNDTGRAADAADLSLNPGENELYRHPTLAAAQQMAQRLGATRPVRVAPTDDGRFSVISGRKPQAEYPTAKATSFIAGIENPDGTTKGLSTPEIRAVAKTIARLVEGGNSLTGANGIYDAGNNTIRVSEGPERERVLGHETGHAIEALAGVAKQLGVVQTADPAKGFQLIKELAAVSSLERPHLWANDKALEDQFDRPAKYIHEYRMRLDELLADGFRHYMTNPASMKKTAPLAARFMRDLVNPSKIGKVIAFAGLGSLALPALIAQSLSQQDDKKEA